jgi:hypothetical protein
MLIIHPTIEEKLKNKHEIDNPRHVVSSLFGNLNGVLLIDTREKNLVKNDGKDYIPTEWFVAKHGGQYYKVVFIRKGADIILKTAYVTKPKYIQMYKDHQIKGFDIAPLKAEMTKLLKGK